MRSWSDDPIDQNSKKGKERKYTWCCLTVGSQQWSLPVRGFKVYWPVNRPHYRNIYSVDSWYDIPGRLAGISRIGGHSGCVGSGCTLEVYVLLGPLARVWQLTFYSILGLLVIWVMTLSTHPVYIYPLHLLNLNLVDHNIAKLTYMLVYYHSTTRARPLCPTWKWKWTS